MSLKRPIPHFLTRWLVSSLGLWIAAGLISGITYNHHLSVIILAGLILAIINTIAKPILVVLALPAVILSLGLFLILINGLTVYLTSLIYHPLHISNFWTAIFAGIIVGLVNYLLSMVVKDFQKK